jgi:hypothetical protein
MLASKLSFSPSTMRHELSTFIFSLVRFKFIIGRTGSEKKVAVVHSIEQLRRGWICDVLSIWAHVDETVMG